MLTALSLSKGEARHGIQYVPQLLDTRLRGYDNIILLRRSLKRGI